MHQRTIGPLFTVLAAALFGTLGIFGKRAAAVDLSVTTLLAGRFLVATLLVRGVLRCDGGITRLPGRVVGLELGLGAVYGVMSPGYFEEVADGLDISQPAAGGLLRRGLRRLVVSTVAADAHDPAGER